MSAPQEIPLKVLESVTNNFADANVIAEGGLGKIYKGQLSLSGELIDVSVRRISHSFWLQDCAFDKEISILSRLKHENMVSIVGFCYENNEVLIINKSVANGSLSKHLSSPTLTWMRRLQISIGAVRALNYLHNGTGHGFSVIHRNITTSSILLDENWEAKISGFEFSMTIPSGVQDLAYEKLGIGTYKSDVFSIGIVLFELLCGKEAFLSKDDNSFQASLAIFHYENGKLHTLVDPDLFRQMDQQSFIIFSKTAYNCLINRRSPPDMNEVLQRLKKALQFQQMHENNEQSTVAVERSLPHHLKLKLKSLEHMRIRHADILDATKNYDPKYLITSGGYGSVYRAKLNHVDKGYCSAIEEEDVREVPKTHSEVAIKRITNTGDEIEEQGFYAEIEMLTSCKHSSILTLLGFCDEGLEMILIYEYASNKSLNYHLQNKSNNHNISWVQRLKICLNVAKGLSFLHTTQKDRQEILHRDIKSANILLDGNFEAKIGDFGLSVFLSVIKKHDTRYSRKIAGTPQYIDPQYSRDGKLKKASDVYSFGVVLIEMLCGTLAYDPKFANNKGLALVARQHFNKKTIMEILDPILEEEITKILFTSIKGPNQESLYTFCSIAYKCLAEEQLQRPTMEVVIKELETALFFQENPKHIIFPVSLEDIELATDNFSDNNCIRYDGFWKAYKGVVSSANANANACTTKIDVNRFFVGCEEYYKAELKVLMEHKHENVIALLGYCEEGEEIITVYEHALNGSLDDNLQDVSLTWAKRLKICIGIASGLEFLHGGFVTGERVIHRDIKTGSILLDGDMNAKIANFQISFMHPIDEDAVFLDYCAGTIAYLDPEYEATGLLSKECDIYSFGIVLFEILVQRLAYDFDFENEGRHLGPLIKDLYKKGKLDEVMYEGKNEQIAPQSLTIFRRIAIQCLHENREERPTAGELIIQLKQALEIQEKGMDIVRISLEDILYATDNFSDEKCIGVGGHGTVFKGQLPNANGQRIAARRFHKDFGQEAPGFYQELEIFFQV